jgi:thiol-disulfide isomerase/thioredoxin
MDWTVRVVRANKDGSFRLVISQQDAGWSKRQGKKTEDTPRKMLVYADVFPDGRVLPNHTIKYRGHPQPILPGLPKDAAEAARGWTRERDGDKVVAKPVKAEAGFRFEAVRQSVFDVIYVSSSKTTYSFDAAKGLIAEAESAHSQGWGFVSKGTGTTKLSGVKDADATRGKQLAAEEGPYFASVEAYDKAMSEAGMAGKAAAERAGKALDALKEANRSLSHPALKADYDERVKQHERMAKWAVGDAERREAIMGKPAVPFETKDVDGKAVKLADLKGKVVVLDFWYRGCGWCVKAMPQMNQLAEDFAGKDVVILGMNTDEKEEDARFVIDKMKLRYPTLKAAGLPQKFGVQSFPTLLVIDQEGKVHDVHVGYTPTLRQDVGRQIRGLLERK